MKNTRRGITIRSFKHATLMRKLACFLAFSLLAPTILLAQEQKRILVPADQQPDAAKKPDGQRAAKPELVLQTGITAPPAIIAFSPDGQLLASMSFYGGAINLWEVATGRQLHTLNLGERSIMALARSSAFCFSADGSSLLTFSANRLKQWDARTGRELRATALNSKQDTGTANFSPDGRLLVTIDQTQQVISVWDTGTGRQVQSLNASPDNSNNIYAAAFSPDGRTLALVEELRDRGETKTNLVLRDVASWRVSATTKIYDEKAKMGTHSYMRPRALRFSPDGRTIGALLDLFTMQVSMTVNLQSRVADRESTVRLWDGASGRELRGFNIASVRGENASVDVNGVLPLSNRLVFNNDGRQLIVCEGRTASLLDIAAGSSVATLTGHAGEIIAVVLSADGRQAATAGVDNTIRIWELAAGRATLARTLGAGAMPVRSLAYEDDGRTLATGGSQAVNLWEMTTGTAMRALELPQTAKTSVADMSEAPERSYFSAGGRFIAASGGAGDVKLWEARTGREVRALPISAGQRLNGASINRDGSLLAITETSDRTGTSPQAGGPQTATAITPATPTLTPTDPNAKKKDDKQKEKDARKEMKDMQRDMMKQMEQMAKSGKTQAGTPPAVMPDPAQMQKIMEAAQRGEIGKVQEAMGQMLGGLPAPVRAAMVGPSTSVKLYDVNAGREVRTLTGPPTMGADSSASIAFSPDGRIIATATGGRSIKIADLANGNELMTIAPDRGMQVNSLAFSPDGRTIATGLMETKPGVDMTLDTRNFNFGEVFAFTVKLWNVSGQSVRELQTLSGHTANVMAIAFSRDGRTIATGSFDATIKLWDAATGRELKTLAGHTFAVNAIDFSPDGRFIVSGSEDGSSRLWDSQTGELLATLVTLNNGADWLVITPDGLFDGTPAAWGQILWRFSPNIFDVAPVEIFFNEFFYPGLLSAIYSGKRPRAAQDVSEKDRRQPVISITRADGQPSGASVATRTIKIRIDVAEPVAGNTVTASPAGARDIRLFRNGTLVKVWRGDVMNGQKQVSLETTLPIVAGENRLTAYGFNRDNVKSVDAGLLISGALELRRKGTAYVLAFGVNSYANEQYNLKYAVADATAFADEVRGAQMKLQSYERVEIISLMDKDATKENILLALKRLTTQAALPAGAPAVLSKIEPAQPEDAVMIYFAGHGTAQGARFYLVPHDLGYAGPRAALDGKAVQAILAHSISDLELEAAVEGLDAEQMLLVIDACNSGQALEAEEKRRGPMNSKGLAQLAYEKGMYILTAAQSYQAALEAAQLGHGYLTYALIEEGLKNKAADKDRKDGQILAREWFDYAMERVPQMQEKEMRARLLLQTDVAFVEGEEKIKDPGKRSVQRPRAFYRREMEARPMIVAKP
ncbi:MAG: caspase family protein [Blastocatellia bacterium]